MKKPKFFFTVRRKDSSRQYAHLIVSVYPMPTSEYHTGLEKVFELRWQSDVDQTPASWYAPHFEIDTDDPPQVMPLATRLIGKHPLHWDAAKWVKDFEAAGFERRIYDGRLSQYLPVSEVVGPEYRRWINDRSRANGETLVSCLARDEEEAMQLLTGKFADHISTPHRHYTSLDCATQAMAAWLAADRPVTYCSHEHPPDITPMAELLKPYGKPAPEPEVTTEAAPAPTEHAEEPAEIAA